MAYFIGTPNNDTYSGGSGNDGINGLGGDDVLDGGGGQDTVFGGDGHDWLDGGTGIDTLGGGLGNDTFVVDDAGDVVLEGANQGVDLVRASVSFSLAGRQIEYLTLTGAAHIDAIGNGLNNLLIGNTGNNVLDGGIGNDIMAGGLGDDTYIVDAIGDNVSENYGEGVDTIRSSVTYSLFGRAVEYLTLTGDASINATGNGLNNLMTGNAGNNVLDGATGKDILAGGLGDDTYYVDNTGDNVAENHLEGADTIYSTVSYSLFGRAVETLILTGSAHLNATGNGLNNVLTGNSGNNALDGGAGNDVLNGGTGNDTLTGGSGNDSYYLTTTGDVVVEAASGGTDTVFTSYNYFMEGLGVQWVENITLLANAGSIHAAGNALNNVLTGNKGDNALSGADGNDTLIGGLGNDTYYVEQTGDVVIENPGQGNDTLITYVTYSLADLPAIETIDIGHARPVGATGNDLNNEMSGNNSHNFLDGGFGDDTMTGRLGHDTYYVDSAGDVVIEAEGGGVDQVVTGLSYSLGAWVENLTLTGAADVNGNGNDRGNVLIGNDGANVLDGRQSIDTLNGGWGNDTLTGGTGADTFQFSTGSSNDQILDFQGSAGDRIDVYAYTGGASNPALVSQSGADVLIDFGGGNTVLILTDTVDNVVPYIFW
ncbi:hypothetical protein ABAC460_13575 [Asticcacaulis sp. AC460]|uniref:beta strand repeat-containing protein n=1 Tax=Asticcacaulis sp. AC460 TaxID=1282360 RepID=UPI0003C40EDB|nr:calcium-binding protein [Asticcacaulis sp. AC460]ESQ89094.1 hypothetical protein ABAC460_13575 [Asticcacaulis sp. AC460]